MKETEEERQRRIESIEEFDDLIEENNFSYYEAAAYAYNHDRHDWIKLLRSKAYGHYYSLICRRKKYNKSLLEAHAEYCDAKAAYWERHISPIGTWQD